MRHFILLICMSVALTTGAGIHAQTTHGMRPTASVVDGHGSNVYTPVSYCEPTGCAPTGCSDIGCAVSGCASGGCGAGCSSCSCNSLVNASACGSSALCGGGCNGSCCGIDEKLFGVVVPSDRCFQDFLSPMTNPIYFEDPRTLSEARFIFLHHKVPAAAGGGEVDLFALQLRAALTDRLSLVAVKDGFATSSNLLIDDGWADVAAGLKYNLFKDACTQRILSAGVIFELPVGSTRTLQGNGDGLFDVFLSAGAKVGAWHWLSTSGFLLPTDSSEESQIWFWSNHWDRRIGCSNLHFLTEVNWYHYLQAGDGGLPGVEGGDLINLGSTGVAGNDIATGAVGLKYRPSYRTEIGVAWEIPLTERKDVLDNRLTFDWIFRY